MGEEGTNAGGNEGGGEGAVETPAWMNSMPDAYKQNEDFAKFGEAADAYAKFDELLKADGDALKIPGEDATDEDKNAFAQKLGRPETAEGYEIGKPDDLPEGVEYNEELEAAFRDTAFNLGMPKSQAEAIYSWYNSIVAKSENDRMIADQAALDKSVNELKDEWKGDAFKVNVELAHRVFTKFVGEEAQAFIDEARVDGVTLGNHPMFLKAFHGISKVMANDALDSGRDSGNGMLSDEAKAQKRFPNTKFKT